ncbi:MAG: rod shape-determining protein MreC [Alphaproteobacteria bacterium]|nr:rod shape-determining protein MreC [Alphaproteobacteria bacterium]
MAPPRGLSAKAIGRARRLLTGGVGIGLLAATAATLMVLDRIDNAAVERLRIEFTDLAVPAIEAMSQPVVTARRVATEAGAWVEVRRQNARLTEENDRLRQWQTVARKLEQENAALRAQLAVRGEAGPRFVTARVVGDSGGPFVRTLLLGAGGRDGLKAGNAAVVGEGLVGRLVEVGERASRILLLSDLNSRVPIMLENGRYRGILAGDNSGQPRLVFLASAARPTVGERIVTSGHDGVLPPGLPVGVIASLGPGDPRVALFADLSLLEFVRVLQHDPPRVGGAGGRDGQTAVTR